MTTKKKTAKSISPTSTVTAATELIVDKETANAFFAKIQQLKDVGALDMEAKGMIEEHPGLLSYDKYENKVKEHCTIAEYLCQDLPDVGERDLLHELLNLGAEATDKCYQHALDFDGLTHPDIVLCLLQTGRFPIEKIQVGYGKPDFFLDLMVEGADDVEMLDECMKLLVLSSKVKVGDWFSFGNIKSSMVQRFHANFPKLEPGVTHKVDGPFAELESTWRAQNVEEEGEAPKKKQRSR